MARLKPTRGLALALVAFVAGTIGPEVASGSPGPSASAYHAVNPVRVVDTRTGLGGSTMGPGSVLTVALAGAAGGVSAGATAVALNVTVANGSSTSYLTVWPAGASQPEASSLNWTDGLPRANSVTSKLGADGAISLFNESGSVDVIIDVVGYYESAYVAAPAGMAPYVVDAVGHRLGTLVSVAGVSYSVLADDGQLYNWSAGTGKMIVTAITEAFLTTDCTGPSKWQFGYAGAILPQMVVAPYQSTSPGETMYVPGTIDPAYAAWSVKSAGVCFIQGGTPGPATDLVPHGTIPVALPAPLSIRT
jgi:hypothetical protein